MRSSIREDIISTARRLFNERGYGNVSLRNISDALHISVGNLTYHFPKKQDLLEAIMSETLPLVVLDRPVLTLSDLYELLTRMMDSLLYDAFFFCDQAVYSINSDGEKHVAKLHEQMRDGLAALVGGGILSERLDAERREAFTRVIMLSHIAWIQQNAPFRHVSDMDRTSFLRMQWLLLEPYLTLQGEKEYRQILSEMKDAPGA